MYLRKLMLLGMLGICGCTLLPERSTSPAVPPTMQAATAPPVQPDDVTAANAREKLRQLQLELEQDGDASQ